MINKRALILPKKELSILYILDVIYYVKLNPHRTNVSYNELKLTTDANGTL